MLQVSTAWTSLFVGHKHLKSDHRHPTTQRKPGLCLVPFVDEHQHFYLVCVFSSSTGSTAARFSRGLFRPLLAQAVVVVVEGIGIVIDSNTLTSSSVLLYHTCSLWSCLGGCNSITTDLWYADWFPHAYAQKPCYRTLWFLVFRTGLNPIRFRLLYW